MRGYDNDNYIEFKAYSDYHEPPLANLEAIINDFDYISFIKENVQTKVNRWQQKGEFEKMADYNIRVTKNTLSNIIMQFQQEAIDLLSYYYWNIIGYKASFELISE